MWHSSKLMWCLYYNHISHTCNYIKYKSKVRVHVKCCRKVIINRKEVNVYGSNNYGLKAIQDV